MFNHFMRSSATPNNARNRPIAVSIVAFETKAVTAVATTDEDKNATFIITSRVEKTRPRKSSGMCVCRRVSVRIKTGDIESPRRAAQIERGNIESVAAIPTMETPPSSAATPPQISASTSSRWCRVPPATASLTCSMTRVMPGRWPG